ncbi:MAG: GNAT family N-acetyltransferase [Candidatus Dormibacteraeota bacterium]|uniref:GNAT family N-acetyltransferase n=2 Tax=Candidatus Aeolococcus gillhamiae TaxID=3127015 RepID=A0A934JWB0_9BACT|nr:GNAT family N-acetyltransferase [Candidatus Dormibacteraeota bacterium]
MADGVSIQSLDIADAAALAEMNARNRSDIERVSPPQTADTYTASGQAARIAAILRETSQGVRLNWTIRLDGVIAGDISLHAIHRGPVQTANVGYMVDSAVRGRGVATAALRLVVAQAFDGLRLHRLDAGAMPTNIGSQRVLEKAGFTRVGVMRRYLFIADLWQDHVLYELVGPDFVPST